MRTSPKLHQQARDRRPPSPRTLPRASRAAVVAALLVGFVTASSPAEAQDVPPSLTALRAQRAVLVRRIAALTDRVEDAERKAANARARQALTSFVLEDARQTFVAFAVDAFIEGLDDPEEAQLREKAWTESIAATEKATLLELRQAEGAVTTERSDADAALDEARRLKDQLEETRRTLAKTITDRETADEATRRVEVDAGGTRRSVPATRSQAGLMARFPFGPVAGIPPGMVATGEVLDGMASWYGPGFDGRRTASGAIFDQEGYTVAHRTLPLGTVLLLTRGDRRVLVLVNDRGPFVGGRILDLSHGVAVALGTVSAGVARVSAQLLSVEG